MVIAADLIKKYQNIVLNNKSFKAFNCRKKGSDSHLLILQSKDGLLLDLISFFYIKSIFDGDDADCFTKLQKNNIPDVIYLPREEKLAVSDAEFIATTAYLTPIQYSQKLYVIEKGETMNTAMQNKLLKLFEEPPKAARFLIKCSSLYTLLPTVKSRGEIIEIEQADENELFDVVKDDVDGKLRELIRATSFGRLDYTEQLIADKTYVELERIAFEMLINMKRSSDMLKYSSIIVSLKDYIDTFIFYIECILHDCMLNNVGEGQKIRFAHHKQEIEALSREFTAEVVLKLKQAIERARIRSNGYGNVTGIVDELLFSILEVKTKWQRL